MLISHAKKLAGEVSVPGDKSISHRAVILGSIASGVTEIRHFLLSADCLATIDCFQKMGIEIVGRGEVGKDEKVVIRGRGMRGLREPSRTLQAGNSGTTLRLLTGLLAPQRFTSRIDGDESLRRRPMNRIIEPLSLMGGSVQAIGRGGCAPVIIHGNPLIGLHYESPVASAQVKSSILLAGLYADGETTVTEPGPSRNHTELMLRSFGQPVQTNGSTVTLRPEYHLQGREVTVPGDISSAACFAAAGLIIRGSELCLKNVGVNPTRSGFLKVCEQMGAKITRENERTSAGEPSADLIVKSSSLTGIEIGGDLIPTLIDELPILAVLACFASGTTVIKDASELKVKETNRIDAMVENLKRLGADIEATEDGMVIHGGRPLKGTALDSRGDHRVAMACAVAALAASGDSEIAGAECVEVSYPAFFDDLKKLIQDPDKPAPAPKA